jgi:hypothetical protein
MVIRPVAVYTSMQSSKEFAKAIVLELVTTTTTTKRNNDKHI